jgi:hypothetical protein
MKVIFSYINNSYAKHPPYLECSAIANFYAQQQGFETIFYGDEISLKSHSGIKYNHTCRLPTEQIKNFPKCFWSAGKLIALSCMNEPCIHVDSDFFITKPINNDFLKNDIVCFHEEIFINNPYFKDPGYKKLKTVFGIQPKECDNIQGFSYNCGIIGGSDIITIKRGIEIISNFISEHSVHIDNIHSKNYYLFTSVLIEQIWLFQIYKYFGKKINALIDANLPDFKRGKVEKDTGYFHLMGSRKYRLRDHICNFVEKNNISFLPENEN